MSSGELRRSSHITELEARRSKQENSKKERKLAGAQETGTKKVPKKKRGKKGKNGPVPGLDGTSTGQDHYTFDADVAFGIALPSKEKLMQVLDRLQQKDKNGYFAEPVDTNEVEHYYDVITEPMDYSTIEEKIDGGSNAMLFNARDTVFYKQENNFGYSKSLMQFAKDMGPTTQMVTKRKLEGGVSETSTRQITTSNFNLQTSNIEQGWGSHYPD